MSMRLSLREALARREEIPGDRRNNFNLNVHLQLCRNGEVKRPIDVALTLKHFGLSLSEAHDILDRIAADEAVWVKLGGADQAVIIDRFSELRVAAMVAEANADRRETASAN